MKTPTEDSLCYSNFLFPEDSNYKNSIPSKHTTFFQLPYDVVGVVYEACVYCGINKPKARADLDISTVIRWRLLCLHKDILVIILHSIAVL